MSYDTKYPSHACVYSLNNPCTQDPSSVDTAYINKSLNEMLTEANKCFNNNGDGTYTTYDMSFNCKNIFYDLSKVALSVTDPSYQNLLDLVNQVNTDLKILRKEDDPSLKAGIEEKTRDLNKSLLMNIMWTTLAVTTLYYVFRKI